MPTVSLPPSLICSHAHSLLVIYTCIFSDFVRGIGKALPEIDGATCRQVLRKSMTAICAHAGFESKRNFSLIKSLHLSLQGCQSSINSLNSNIPKTSIFSHKKATGCLPVATSWHACNTGTSRIRHNASRRVSWHLERFYRPSKTISNFLVFSVILTLCEAIFSHDVAKEKR